MLRDVYVSLSLLYLAVFHLRAEMTVLQSYWKHLSLKVKYARAGIYRFKLSVSDILERSQQKIAEIVALKPFALAESVIKKLTQCEIVVPFRSESEQASPDISWREIAELITQPSSAPSAVKHRDYGRYVFCILLQAFKDGIASCPSPYDNNFGT